MANFVQIKNDQTGEIKRLKVGWSWVLFWFSGFLGIPLFMRRLYLLGGIFLGLWVVNLFAQFIIDPMISIVLIIVMTTLSIWLGVKGNEITGKNYLEQGWSFVDPDGLEAKYARSKWSLMESAS